MGSLKNEEELEGMEEWSREAILYVNGVRKILPDGLAHLTLLEYLRGNSVDALFVWLLGNTVEVVILKPEFCVKG